ncbi:osmoprotectant transport system permease protein [Pedobacter westerhofensis]|uniref:Osmoprotectant transport system permease protein n=1 Tax=Pedobacter westerhofensis TaxID=425512 RepID=A0A521FAP4_9SPHI|nr:ABC transporter permease/substrate-binding protein [Pedobacter westerhofensis]SMO93216.1 osmoprotectant transport system permease protein [Pedobacter westerhofensis]
MDQTQTFWQFVNQQSDKLWNQTWAHIGLTMISLILAIIIAVPVGILIARKQKLSGIVLGIAGVLQTIPSIALLGVMIPFLGIGPKPAILALFLYALLPVIRNTYTGIMEVNPAVVDAAKGMGMSKWQILTKVELPLAFPVLMAGIRTATVINVGVATLAAYIAAGGLGEFIFGGIALNNSNMILAGAIPAALLAIILDFLLSLVQKINLKSIRVSWLILPFVFISMSSFYLLPTQIGGRMLGGFTPEFMGREDGYLGLKSVYRLGIETVVISDAVMYKAAFEHKLDVISGYSTDGRLKAYDLITLKDDKGIFPPYYAAPVIRNEVLTKYPELEAVLNQLSGSINDSIMTALNYKVDQLKQSPEQVAMDFMVSKHLYKPSKNGTKGTVRIGSKIFGEQYILAQMYKILILGNTDLTVLTKTGLGGTKICFDALTNNQIDFYPEYTGTGFLVLLKPDKKTIKQLEGNTDGVYQYVSQAFNKQFNIKWLKPIGFNNSYALMMRKEQAQSLHIESITDLTNHLKHK